MFEENAQLTILSKSTVNTSNYNHSANDSDNFEDAETGALFRNLHLIEVMSFCLEKRFLYSL